MARKPRVHVPYSVYHVMLRGNNKQQIFFSDADRCHLSLILQEATVRFNCRIHAFCFMGNHVHLALQISEIPLSKIMHNVAFRYASWLNSHYDRVGHLFQGRYRAILVDHNEYLLTLIRYIHLNPVKAKIVNDPNDYYWSGQRTYCGVDNFPWLTTNWVLALLSDNPQLAVIRYQELLMLSQETNEDAFFSQYPVSESILGNDEFRMNMFEVEDHYKSEFKNRLLTTQNVVKFICQKHKISENMLYTRVRHKNMTEIRADFACLCVELNICSVKEISVLLQRSPSHISHLIHDISQTQQERIEKFKRELSGIILSS